MRSSSFRIKYLLVKLVKLLLIHDVSANHIRKSLTAELGAKRRRMSQNEVRRIRETETSESMNYYFPLISRSYSDTAFFTEIDDSWMIAAQTENELNGDSSYPFLVCINKKGKKSGNEGQKILSKFIAQKHSYPLLNNKSKSCFSIKASKSEAEFLSESNIFTNSNDEFTVIPYTSSMKMEKGMLDEVKKRILKSNSFGNNRSLIELIVTLSPGVVSNNNILKQLLTNLHGLVSSMTAKINDKGGSKRNLRERRDYTSLVSFMSSSIEQTYRNTTRKLSNNGYCDDILSTIEEKLLSSGERFTVKIKASESSEKSELCTMFIIAAISYDPHVLYISLIPQFTVFNDAANNIIQGASDKPFYNGGLDGKGQVIAVSDTGLDLENCYFHDSIGTVPKNGTIQPERRKVIQYIPVDDSFEGYLQDDYAGHG